MNINFNQIARPLREDKIHWPALLPYDLFSFLSQHIDMILPGESITLPELANRIKTASTQAYRARNYAFVNRLMRWSDFMQQLDNRQLSAWDATLPQYLTFQGAVTEIYTKTHYCRLLGQNALNYLMREPGQWHGDWAPHISKTA